MFKLRGLSTKSFDFSLKNPSFYAFSCFKYSTQKERNEESKQKKKLLIEVNPKKLEKLPKKVQARFEAWKREQWHLRQNKGKEDQKKGPSKPEMSKNKIFRQIPIDPKIKNYIVINKICKTRKPEKLKTRYDTKKDPKLQDKLSSDAFYSRKVNAVGFATKKEDFPRIDFREIALVGKSNVGKSSLLNSLVGIPNKALVQDRPGTTRAITWYQVGFLCCLVDLPGYGFAYVSEETRNSWRELIEAYFSRKQLKRVCLLVDARHGMKSSDREIVELLKTNNVRYQVVLTKCDLVFADDLARIHHLISKEVEGDSMFASPIVMLSSKTGAGMEMFKNTLASLLEVKKREESKEKQPK